eukprot:COSAG06_NODE_1771_length_8429_cov_4.298679_2_plen_73_part_00
MIHFYVKMAPKWRFFTCASVASRYCLVLQYLLFSIRLFTGTQMSLPPTTAVCKKKRASFLSAFPMFVPSLSW